MARPLAREESALSDWIVLLALAVTVVIVLGVYFVVLAPRPLAAVARASQGDKIEVDYVGYLQGDDLVFDTSLRSVAADNATYAKAFGFGWRSSWGTLQFTIGDGTLLKGFDLGVRGLAVGETTTLVIPASLGYGPANPSLIRVHPLTETVPVRRTMNQTDFQAYYKQVAVSGSNVTDPVYGWSVSVAATNGLITITNDPYPFEVLRPYHAWGAKVLAVDDTANNGTGAITVENHLDPSQVDRIGGTAADGRTFYLSSVDPVAGTYTIDFNKQVVGRTLVFQVTLVSIVSGF